MTTPTSAAARRSGDLRAESFFDWVHLHVREVIGAIIVVAVLGAGVSLYQRSQRTRAEQAARALDRARQSVRAGNAPLAQTDLRRVADRFSSTSAALEASMLLAQVLYDQGKYDEGIKALSSQQKSRSASADRATLEALIAAGYEQAGKPVEAAAHYEKAAAAAALGVEKAEYQASAARCYASAGNGARARALWRQVLESNSAPTLIGEARIRLGELSARPAGAPGA